MMVGTTQAENYSRDKVTSPIWSLRGGREHRIAESHSYLFYFNGQSGTILTKKLDLPTFFVPLFVVALTGVTAERDTKAEVA